MPLFGTLVQFGLYPNISKKKVPFFKSGTTHAGCNGNLGFLFSVSTLRFSFAEPRRYRLTPHMGPQDPPPPDTRTPDHSLANQKFQDWLRDGHVTHAGPTGSLFLRRCDLLAAILLPHGTNVRVNENKSEGNKAQKWKKTGFW